MKALAILILMFSANAHANEAIICANPQEPQLTYVLTSAGLDKYEFSVKETVFDSRICGSRWGCDNVEKVLFTDEVELIDYQGALVFESRRTYIEIEDNNGLATYQYPSLNLNGEFESKTVTLICQ